MDKREKKGRYLNTSLDFNYIFYLMNLENNYTDFTKLIK